MNPLYEILFSDGEFFIGGNLQATKWVEIPLKPIEKFTYYVPNTNKVIIESNFKRIYHMVEVTTDFSGPERGKVKLEYTYLIVEREYEYECYKNNLITKKTENILYKKDNEWIKKLNPSFWRG